ncbi:MAG: PspC domain-containing protein [Actinobacteria bacterium]|nr:PspC domain-containing protein [Actinomycetota bacterium]
MKRLYRSRTDRVLAGVCGGLAEYFDLDVTIVRLLWVLITLVGGAGILAYIVAAIVIPEKRGFSSTYGYESGFPERAPGAGVSGAADSGTGSPGTGNRGSDREFGGGPEASRSFGSGGRRYNGGRDSGRTLGIILVALGGIFLLRNLVPWHFGVYWPVILIILGAAFLAGGLNRGDGR